MIKDSLVLEIKSALEKEPAVLGAYVIGSFLSGNTTVDSDFDLVIVTQNRRTLDQDQAYELVRQIAFPKNLDLSVVDRNSSPIFLFQVVNKGKRIYARNKAEANNFEAFALHNYYDTAHLRSIYSQSLQQKFPTHVY